MKIENLGDGIGIASFDSMQEMLGFLDKITSGQQAESEPEPGEGDSLEETMTARMALVLSIAAMLGAGREQAQGHLKCAKFKLAGAQQWKEIHDRLAVQESLADAEMSDALAEDQSREQDHAKSYAQGYNRGYAAALKDNDHARLGLATNQELLQELANRFAIPMEDPEGARVFERLISDLSAEALAFRTASGGDGSGNEDAPVS